MPNQKIFCSVPWTNTHIYWDGSFGMCCSEKHAPHQAPAEYNISRMTVQDWFNSEPMQQARQAILGNTPLTQCQGCYHEEQHGYESRRIRENFKTVIFTELAFERSFDQSPMRDDFIHSARAGTTDRVPVDWHVDLGNECNLACKMCSPQASSRINELYRRWQLIDQSRNSNWTRNEQAWSNFLQSILDTPNLNRLHFMGGEPLMNRRFSELLNFLLDHKRQDLSISFVSNGTMIDTDLVSFLKQFRNCNIEISLESISDNNDYIRQGSSTAQVLSNLKQLIDLQDDRLQVVLRSVPQLLNINNYDQYLSWAWQQQVHVQGIPLIDPPYLQISVLPWDLRQTLIPQYQRLKQQFDSYPQHQGLYTGRNTSTLAQSLSRECASMILMLSAPEPNNVVQLRQQLAAWLRRWDREFDLDARQFYPEYREFLDAIGYHV